MQLAARDPRTPAVARWLILAALAYALSPIDLIPDFVPVVGLLDDLLLVPAALWLARRLVPDEVWHDARARADGLVTPANPWGAVIVAVVWAAAATLAGWWLLS